ncbi:ABC transporter permease [Dysosmobacter sp.]
MELKKEAAERAVKKRKIRFDYPWISAAVPLVVLMAVLPFAHPMFLTTSNILGILRQAAVYVIMGLGMSFVLMTGGIDLSQGSLLALVGVVSAYIVENTGSIFLAILAGVVVGALTGAANGVVISCLKIPPFIMTLSTMYLCRGLTLVITKASPIAITNSAFKWIGGGSLLGIPVPVLIFIIAAAVGQFILSYTATGRYILAVGSNREAARLSGIKTRWNECKVYIISGVMVAIAGVVYVARLGAAQATAGQSYEMEAVAASVLGGTSVLGGEGGIIGTVMGAVVVAIIRNAIVLLEVSTYYQQMITGAVILIAVIVDVQRKARAAKKVN